MLNYDEEMDSFDGAMDYDDMSEIYDSQDFRDPPECDCDICFGLNQIYEQEELAWDVAGEWYDRDIAPPRQAREQIRIRAKSIAKTTSNVAYLNFPRRCSAWAGSAVAMFKRLARRAERRMSKQFIQEQYI